MIGSGSRGRFSRNWHPTRSKLFFRKGHPCGISPDGSQISGFRRRLAMKPLQPAALLQDREQSARVVRRYGLHLLHLTAANTQHRSYKVFDWIDTLFDPPGALTGYCAMPSDHGLHVLYIDCRGIYSSGRFEPFGFPSQVTAAQRRYQRVPSLSDYHEAESRILENHRQRHRCRRGPDRGRNCRPDAVFHWPGLRSDHPPGNRRQPARSRPAKQRLCSDLGARLDPTGPGPGTNLPDGKPLPTSVTTIESVSVARGESRVVLPPGQNLTVAGIKDTFFFCDYLGDTIAVPSSPPTGPRPKGSILNVCGFSKKPQTLRIDPFSGTALKQNRPRPFESIGDRV